MKTLQEHYNAIQNGKGNKIQFLNQARQLFPQYINQYLDFDTSVRVLKSKQVISEAAGNVVSKGFDIFDWKKILSEEVKVEEKKVSKEVEDANENAYDNKDLKNPNNINFNEIMKGFYAELKDEKNHDKTSEEISSMVVKNLAKDPLYYTKDGMFGEKGVGFTDDAPSLGTPKEPKGKHKSSGYGDLDTKEKPEKVKANVQDSLGDKEAKTTNPSKVKEMEVTPQNSKGVKKMAMPGKEKKIKLQESEHGDSNPVLSYFNEFKGYGTDLKEWLDSLNSTDLENLYNDIFKSNPKEINIDDIKTKLLDYYDNKDDNADDWWGMGDEDEDELPGTGHDESLKESINKKYTHFAIRKSDNKIVNGWETISDVESLKYYAKMDLKDIFPDAKASEFAILSKKGLEKKGIDPFDEKNWLLTQTKPVGENDIHGIAGNPEEEAEYKKAQIQILDPISAQIADLEKELISTIDPERKAEIELKIKELQSGLQEEKLRVLIREIIKEELDKK